ncbi:MAG TPA: hypothetical protein VJU86_21315 [Pyrinomonadaceae bacterium]|nr:hypothetical protein [Pyrinomonadaceae bacterium]
MPPFIELERLTRVATLGLRFHDTMTGVFIGSGLNVWAYPVNRPAARRQAISNRSGIYVLHHAAGLIELERGNGSERYWQENSPSNQFIIEVSDEERRFQPFQFSADLPARNIYKWNGPNSGSPPALRSSIPLYSTPVRNVPAGMAVIRAHLWNRESDTGAGWAILEVYDRDRLIGRGLGDEQGQVAVIFPYPQPLAFAPSSPLGSPVVSPLTSPPESQAIATGPPLTNQVWPLQIRVLYSPALADSSPPHSTVPSNTFPDLRRSLSQPEALIWSDPSLSEALTDVSLQYGRELILKSNSATSSPLTSPRNSVLFISPAVSPP